MQVNTSHDDIAEAVGRVRVELALAGPGRVLDLMTPTPPQSPVPTGRTHRSSSGATERLHGAAGGHSSPQADFVIDEDSGQFDDESPALNTADINDFLNWQRQQTVSVMKNAQLEKEVAELEKQLRQMDMMDGVAGAGTGSTIPQRLPSVEKPTVVGARVILSRERPSSGAAVMPDPTATTTHRDDSYTPSGNSSRQSSRGLVKAALRNANSASALEVPSAEHLRQYQSADKPSSKMMVSPPPSPPPPDPENAGMEKTREIEHCDSEGNEAAPEVRRRKQRPDKGENDQQSENVFADPKSESDKPVMRFEQRPHNTHHRRHVGHKRNSSDSNTRRHTTDTSKEEADSADVDALPVPKGVEPSAGQGSLALLNKRHKDKDKVVITRRRRTIEEKGHLEERPVLPNSEVKRLLVPVGASNAQAVSTPAQAVAPSSGGKGRAHHHHHPHPKATGSLSPLHQHAADESAHETHEEGSSKLREKPSGQLLAPLNVVPAIKGDDSEGRVPLLPVGLVKDRGRNNSVLQGVNRRRTRASTDEDPGTLQPSAAAAYLQSISPRDGDGHSGDGSPGGRGHVDRVQAAGSTSDSVTMSNRLSNRINNRAPAASDAIPPLGEHSSQKGVAVRRRRERASSDNLHSNNSESEKLSNVPDSEAAGESSDGRKRAVAGQKRTKRKSFGGNAPTEAEAANSPPKNSSKSSKAWSIDINSKVELGPVNSAAARPWSQTMELRLGEVEFMLRKPITCDEDISSVLKAATDGLTFMDELNSVAKSLDMLRGSLSRWLLPYDNNTRIDEQCSNVRTVVDNMPDYLVGKLTERQVNYLVTEVNKVRQLIRVKIADDNDLEQARTALESTASFFQRLVDEARIAAISPYALLSSKRV